MRRRKRWFCSPPLRGQPEKSGYNKGTIRVNLGYSLGLNEVRRHPPRIIGPPRYRVSILHWQPLPRQSDRHPASGQSDDIARFRQSSLAYGLAKTV